MVVSKFQFRFLCIVLLLFKATIVFGKSQLKLIYNMLKQNGNNGYNLANGKTNQDVSVIEPILMSLIEINENTDITGQFTYDTWTSASDKAFDEYSSASINTQQTRKEYKVGAAFKDDKKQKGAYLQASYSDEWDYKSKGISASINHNLAQDNANINFSYANYDDTVTTYDFINDQIKGNEERLTHIFQLGLSQYLTRQSLISFLYGHSFQEGAMESTLNSVNLNGIRVEDRLPTRRDKNWLSSTYVHALSDQNSVSLTATLYEDSWEMRSESYELNYMHDLADGDGLLNFFCRYYEQNELKYFRPSFNSVETFMTSDSDYQDFNSQHYGMYYQHDFYVGQRIYQLVVGTGHYVRSNELNFTTFQTALGVNF